jgi:phenylalanyl-tRNA synthetase beta chain
VMLEYGHPMHAFDLDQVRGRAVVVRRAREGEPLRTLDGVDRKLTADDLVICDAEGPVALAGVMGGGNSEITAATRRVFLECAYFDPRGVRRAARRHGLHAESSHRFERGVDWGDTRAALARATSLVASLAGATAIAPIRFVEATPLARRTVALRHERAGAVLGATIERSFAHTTLGRLGFACRASEPGMDVWEVPSFRPDVSREIDLVEEIGRVRGYDALPAERPAVRASRDAGPVQALVRRAREAAVANGLSEAVTYAFVSARDLERVGAPRSVVTLRNPLGEQHSVMRTSLLPGLLQALARAQRHGGRDARLFTVAPIFLGKPDASGAPTEVEERPSFAAVLAGERTQWLTKPQPFDVWDAKGLARALVLRLLQREPSVAIAAASDRPAALHPRGAAWVDVAGKRAGSIGPLHPDVADAFEIQGAVVVVELDLQLLALVGPRPLRFASLPRFPSSTRDLAIVVDGNVPAGVVEDAAREAAGDLAEEVVLFDRFVGGSVPAGRTSLALHVVYRAPDRTLTDSEVDARHAVVLAAVEKRFGATLRS